MFKLFNSSLGPCCSLATASHLQTSDNLWRGAFQFPASWLTYISVATGSLCVVRSPRKNIPEPLICGIGVRVCLVGFSCTLAYPWSVGVFSQDQLGSLPCWVGDHGNARYHRFFPSPVVSQELLLPQVGGIRPRLLRSPCCSG